MPNILDSRSLQSALRLSNKLVNDGNFEGAKKTLKDILERFPANKSAANLFYKVSQKLKNNDKPANPANHIISKLITKINQNEFISALADCDHLLESYKQSHILYNIKGAILFTLGNRDEALTEYLRSLELSPKYKVALKNVAVLLKDVKFNIQINGLDKVIVNILRESSIMRPKDVAPAAISLLKNDTSFRKILDSYKSFNFEDLITNLSQYELLIVLMKSCPLPDVEIEELIAFLRLKFLSLILTNSKMEYSLSLIEAIAQQCFMNEYVVHRSETENSMISALQDKIEAKLLLGEQPKSIEIACFGSYKPLITLRYVSNLKELANLKNLISMQIKEPQLENDLKADIKTVTEITDKTSIVIKKQYEAFPYPRWSGISLFGNKYSIGGFFEERKIKITDKTILGTQQPKILIAGCGTGQHCLTTASLFKNSHVFAIDLSKSSLAYAKRKAIELGIANIEFAQADILELNLNIKFDIIECAGVLHHMDNPIAGWCNLRRHLKPSGLMGIALYSKLARKGISQIRDTIQDRGLGRTKNEMISFRKELTHSDEQYHKDILTSADFYSTSGFKDLLFNEKEHTFTIESIRNELLKLNLQFCGFTQGYAWHRFSKCHTDINDYYDLDIWEKFENENPNIFLDMYQFWCQDMSNLYQD